MLGSGSIDAYCAFQHAWDRKYRCILRASLFLGAKISMRIALFHMPRSEISMNIQDAWEQTYRCIVCAPILWGRQYRCILRSNMLGSENIDASWCGIRSQPTQPTSTTWKRNTEYVLRSTHTILSLTLSFVPKPNLTQPQQNVSRPSAKHSSPCRSHTPHACKKVLNTSLQVHGVAV